MSHQSIWKKTSRDAWLLAISLFHMLATIYFALHWEGASTSIRLLFFCGQVILTVYNIIIISHLLSHRPWFNIEWMNILVSMLNSHNIGQSVCAYHLTHVRNHHKYNNDRQGPDGKTRDFTSTYQNGKNGGHDSLFHYAFVSAFSSFVKTFLLKDLLSLFIFFRVTRDDSLRQFLSPDKNQKRKELRQLSLDRLMIVLGFFMFLVISWKWALSCYLPAYYLSLAFVNIQNYYEHYGANPDLPEADSVSCYSKLYNALTFNDGHHQEHHLRCSAHWSELPTIRQQFSSRLDSTPRIISPVPAIVGFLDFNRGSLHKEKPSEQAV